MITLYMKHLSKYMNLFTSSYWRIDNTLRDICLTEYTPKVSMSFEFIPVKCVNHIYFIQNTDIIRMLGQF